MASDVKTTSGISEAISEAEAALKVFDVFKERLRQIDPAAYEDMKDRSAGEAFEILCTRYGLPAKELWAMRIEDCFELLTHGMVLFFADFGKGRFIQNDEPYPRKKILPNEVLPNLVGTVIEILSSSSEGFSYAKVADEKSSLKGVTMMIRNSHIGDLDKRIRAATFKE